jgi:hypothetical protein
MERTPLPTGTINLLDVLDRVLDKGLVIAGDISISLGNVQLLTIRIRLLICSIDKAERIGLDWWKFDPHLTMGARTAPVALAAARRVTRRTRVARPLRSNRRR